MRISKKSIWILSIGILVIVSIGAYWLFKSSAQVMPRLPATPVKLVKVTQMNLPVTVTAMGQLVAPESITLKAQQAGAITKLLVKNGQLVKQGQLLLRIQNSAQLANVAKAEAAAWVAKRQFERLQQLNKQGAISRSDYDTAVSNYKQEKADLAAAKQSAQETKVTAPFAGQIGIIAVAVGSDVDIGDDLLPLTNRNEIEVGYTLPQGDYNLAKLGQSVELTAASASNKNLHATVTYISPTVSETSRAFTVRATVKDSQHLLAAGMLATVTQILQKSKQVAVIPAVALVPSIDGMTVYQVKKNKVYSTRVKIARQYKQWAIISSGLKVGQAIVASGNVKVHLGSKVKVVSSQPKAVAKKLKSHS